MDAPSATFFKLSSYFFFPSHVVHLCLDLTTCTFIEGLISCKKMSSPAFTGANLDLSFAMVIPATGKTISEVVA